MVQQEKGEGDSDRSGDIPADSDPAAFGGPLDDPADALEAEPTAEQAAEQAAAASKMQALHRGRRGPTAAAAAAELGLHAADCGVIPWNQYSDLHGLPMIPLADGVTMAKFADVTHGACYYLGNELEHEILSSLPHLLVDRACCRVSDETVLHTPEATSIITHLSASSLQRVTNVSPLGPVTLSKLLPMVLPAAWEGVDEVKDWATAGAVLPEWVKLLWKYLLEPDTPNQGAASPAAGSSTPDLPLLQGSQKAPAAPVPLDYYVEYPLLPTDQGSLLRLARRRRRRGSRLFEVRRRLRDRRPQTGTPRSGATGSLEAASGTRPMAEDAHFASGFR